MRGEARRRSQDIHSCYTTPAFPSPGDIRGEDAAGSCEGTSLISATREAAIPVRFDVERGSLEAEKLNEAKETQTADADIKSLMEFCTMKPNEVTLNSLWDFFSQMCKVIVPQVATSQQKFIEMEKALITHETEIATCKSDIGEIRTNFMDFKQQQDQMVKDNIVLRYKLENMENSIRAANLRFLNFPKLPLIGAREMFKRYVVEILNVPAEKVPLTTKAFYLPTGKRKPTATDQEQIQAQNMEMDTLDLTNFLETSDSEQVSPSTMIVSFSSVAEKEWLLRTFYKNREKVFLKLKISIFPDVSRETQKRRKQFLSLKMSVLQLGALFFLKFPCKCMVKYQSIRYVFFDPMHLSAFLSSKSCVSSTPTALVEGDILPQGI